MSLVAADLITHADGRKFVREGECDGCARPGLTPGQCCTFIVGVVQAIEEKDDVELRLARDDHLEEARRVEPEAAVFERSIRARARRNAVGPGDRVLLIDDVLATGGTASAAVRLLQACGALVLGCAFVIELGFLNGRPTLGVPATSVLVY